MSKVSLNVFRIMHFILFAFSSMLTSVFIANAGEKETAIDRVNIQTAIYPQEKLHMVTDRDLYFGGDTVWFRVFVVDAATHKKIVMSKYTYVELLNPFGEVNVRVKIIENDSVYAGYIPIDEDICEGDYTLAAYTMYSENQGKDYFFRKPLRLLSRHSSKYVIDASFSPVGHNEVNGTFKVRSVNGEKLNYNIMSWTMPDGKFLEMPDANKGFSRKFRRDKGENMVLVRFGDYRKYIPVEFPIERIDMVFYPEGGWLIADEPCVVAFKASDENGKGVKASGIIRNDSGEKVAEFSTVHHGMGSVVFVPQSGETYTAEYIGPDAELRTAEIGTPKPGAASLRYRASGNKSTFSVAGGKGRDLELVLASRGKGVTAATISSASPFTFDNRDMTAGLYQALLLSKTDSAVLSERIFFIGADRLDGKPVELSTDSTAIKMPLINGSTGGDCSIRIINASLLPGKAETDIRTQLLLQSELRGRIENPAYYFSEVDHETERHLDLLMMVNGWSRYNFPEAIMGRYEEPQIPLEIGQEISGQVRSRWSGKPMEGVMIYAIVPQYNFGIFAETDANGNFDINGFDFPEGTVFIFRAMNEKGDNEGNYDFKKDSFPAVDLLYETPASVSAIDPSEFFNGIRWVMLDEIKVQAFNPTEDFDIFKSLAVRSYKSEDMTSRGITSLEQAVRNIPGMVIKNDHLFYRGGYVAFYIDGSIYETGGEGSTYAPHVVSPGKLPGTFARSRFADGSLANLNLYNTRMLLTGTSPNPIREKTYIPSFSDIATVVSFQDIERLDYLKSENFVIGKEYGSGVLMITTKSGNDKPDGNQFELKDYLPLGYQKYKEYSSPILSVDSDEYDLQTQPTLLWLPSVKFDENGKSIDLKFPVKSGYCVIIEGISKEGDIIYCKSN